MPPALRARWQRLSMLARPRQPESLPIVLDRRRIYVLPTGFGLFLAMLLLAMLLGALNYNNNPALLLALLLAAIAMASTLIAHLQLSGLRLEAIAAEPVPAGTAIRLRLTLARNDRRWRHGLHLQHEGASIFTGLADDPRNEVELSLPTRRRGWLAPPRIRLSTTQPLGLARAWSWLWPQAPLLVYPAPERSGPGFPEDDDAPSPTRLHPLGDELQQLRPYRSGDARRTIAWKHSARHDTLLVREYAQNSGSEVLLDWHALTALAYEHRIARLARWVNQAEREGRRYRLKLPDQAMLGPGHGDAHHHQCLRALALLPHG